MALAVLFAVTLATIALTLTVYLLNEQKIQYHVGELNNMKKVQEHLSTFSKENMSQFSLGDGMIPSCMGVYIMDKNIEKMVWSSPESTVAMDASLLDPETKHKIVVRSITGGGLIRLPWRQRNESGRLKDVTASVRKISDDFIGIVLVCD